MKKSSLLLIALLLIMTIAGCQQEAVGGVSSSISKLGDIKNIKIIADQANVFEGCSPGTNVLQSLNKNSQLDVISKVEDYFAVKLPDNRIGFVPEKQCTPIVVDEEKPSPSTENVPQPQTGPLQTTPNNNNLQTNPQGGTPTIPDENTNAPGLTADEQQMIELVNQARAQNNLPALKVDMKLTNVARVKAQDMIDNNYFSHNSPTYGSPFDMMKDFGISYVKAGENIAGNQSVQNAHDSLMNSPGHRANILGADYTHVGIGIKNGGRYGKMFCQMFISKPK